MAAGAAPRPGEERSVNQQGRPHVVVVGSINMDLTVRCCRVPRSGETVQGDELTTAFGGKGANQAVACARLGARTAMVGRVGSDDFGPNLKAGLETEGVDVTWVRADPGAASGVALIILEPSGSNRIIVIGGANLRLDGEEVAIARRLLKQADAVLMQLETPLPVVKAVAEAAREAQLLSVLDAGAATPAAAEAGLPGLVDVISPNESEAEALTGIRVEDVSDAGEAAARLRQMGARHVVIKLGARGTYYLGPEDERHCPAFPVAPIDTTAAGDAHAAALTVSLAGGGSISQAIRRANAAGALACMKLGAQPSMPTAAQVESFLGQSVA